MGIVAALLSRSKQELDIEGVRAFPDRRCRRLTTFRQHLKKSISDTISQIMSVYFGEVRLAYFWK